MLVFSSNWNFVVDSSMGLRDVEKLRYGFRARWSKE